MLFSQKDIVRSFMFGMLFIISVSHAATQTELDAGMVNPGSHEKPDWFKVSFLDLYEDIDEASEDGKRVMLYFYQDGCPYCKKLLEDNFGQRRIADKTKSHFDVVAINIWGDREVTVGDKTVTEKEFATALKVQYTPTLVFFNEQRKPIFRANGYYPPARFEALLDYVSEKQEDRISFQEFYAKRPPASASGKFYDDISTVASPKDLQASIRKGRHMMVFFEQQYCVECDELHQDILKREESIEELAKLEVALVDIWSDEKMVVPDGRTLSARKWAKELDVKYAPSMVFFDDSGAEVFRIDAYLKSFHVQSVMDYVSSGSYLTQTNFQRFIDERADRLREQGVEVNLMD